MPRGVRGDSGITGAKHFRWQGRRATVYQLDGKTHVDFTPALDQPVADSPGWRAAIAGLAKLPKKHRPTGLTPVRAKAHATDQRMRERLREMRGQT